MKTLKKLLGLALVAVLLVSALPVVASAADDTVTIKYTLNGGTDVQTATVAADSNGDITESAVLAAIKADVLVSCEADGSSVTSWPVTYTSLIAKELTVKAHTHNKVQDATKSIAATCTTDGTTEFKCTNSWDGTNACTESYPSLTVAALGHSYENMPVYQDASDGLYYQDCYTCGTANQVTGYATITFVDYNSEKEQVLELYKSYSSTELPTVGTRTGYTFVGWNSSYDGTGEYLHESKLTTQYDTYYAYYTKSASDGQSDVKLYVALYVNGIKKDTKYVTTYQFTNGDNILTWLTNNSATVSSDIFGVISSDVYEWPATRYYYDYTSGTALTSQTAVANGERSILVKVNAKSYATVYLKIHGVDSDGNYTNLRTCDMKDYGYAYMKGDVVGQDDVEYVVMKHYSGTSMKIYGLYSDNAWGELKAGETPSGASGVSVDANESMTIHVVIKNYTSNADSTNPKTGDMIFIPAMVMLASAAAAAYIYMGKKRVA